MTKQDVLKTLEYFSDEFPQNALEEIQANKDNFTTELLNVLDYVCNNAKALCDDESDYFLHVYAMFLLAEFREKRAFPLLIALLRLPEDEVDFILGDVLADGFSQLLLSTFDNENIQMLLDIIEDQAVYKWARLAAVNTYELLIIEGFVANDKSVSYLRNLIYNKLRSDDADVVITAIVGCVIHAQLIDMIPDVRFLYDNKKVDISVYGKYDDFIDHVFYKEDPERHYIDNAISELKEWDCFKNGNNDIAKRSEFSIDKLLDELKDDVVKKEMIEQKPKKVGRNEPCPCGSGKKYKKCCMNAPQKNNPSVIRLEDRYDLLAKYPKDSTLFQQMYEKESVDIDILVYKALHHRSIPMWVKRDFEGERIGKINYLHEALTLFENKCQQAQIASFAAYDKQYMVHYRSSEWVSALVELIEDDDAEALIAIRQKAQDTLYRFL